MTVPVGEVHTIESVLTMVGGSVVYASGPFVSDSAAPPAIRPGR
jgi:hypothetical protein